MKDLSLSVLKALLDIFRYFKETIPHFLMVYSPTLVMLLFEKSTFSTRLPNMQLGNSVRRTLVQFASVVEQLQYEGH
jgi:hypothetical protein